MGLLEHQRTAVAPVSSGDAVAALTDVYDDLPSPPQRGPAHSGSTSSSSNNQQQKQPQPPTAQPPQGQKTGKEEAGITAVSSGDEGEESGTSSDEPTLAAGKLKLPGGWKNSKTYAYLEHPCQSNEVLLGSVLKTLFIKETAVTLKPESGQFVFVEDRKFDLVLCMKVSRLFRVLMRDDESNTTYSAMAKDITAVGKVSGKSKARLQDLRAKVPFFLFACSFLVVVLVGGAGRCGRQHSAPNVRAAACAFRAHRHCC